jgi:heme exporter protein C
MKAGWIASLGLLALGVGMGLWYAPVDEAMGWPQKLVYVHVPSAAVAILAAVSGFVGSVAHLWTRSRWSDELVRSSARVVVMCSLLVLLTGMAWGKSAWGYWWTWSPRLTFTLILCVVYAGLLGMRRVVRPWSRRATASAVYGVVAFVDVPLVYLSVRLMPDVHPSSIPMTPEMKLTLVPWFAFFAAGAALLIEEPVRRRWPRGHSMAGHGRTGVAISGR